MSVMETEKPKVPLRTQLTQIFYFAAGLSVMFEIINIATSRSVPPIETVANISIGVIFLLAAFSLQKGKILLAASLIIAETTIGLIYGYVRGNRFDFLGLLIGMIILGVLFKVWKDGEVK